MVVWLGSGPWGRLSGRLARWTNLGVGWRWWASLASQVTLTGGGNHGAKVVVGGQVGRASHRAGELSRWVVVTHLGVWGGWWVGGVVLCRGRMMRAVGRQALGRVHVSMMG